MGAAGFGELFRRHLAAVSPPTPPVVHADDCPRSPAFIPLWAVGRAVLAEEQPFKLTLLVRFVSVIHPPTGCDVCGTLVTYQGPSATAKKRQGHPVRFYCSPEHKGALPPPAPTWASPPTTPACPHPEKKAFDTADDAAAAFHSLLVADPTLGLYECRCGSWHAGHSDLTPPWRPPSFNPTPSIADVARITHTNPKDNP